MNESFWTAELVWRISELALWVVALGALALLLLETFYLLIFTVFMVRRRPPCIHESRGTPRQERDQCVDQ